MAIPSQSTTFKPIPTLDLTQVHQQFKRQEYPQAGIRVANHVIHNRRAIQINRRELIRLMSEVVKMQEAVNKVIAELNDNLVKTLGAQLTKVTSESLLNNPEIFSLLLQAIGEKQKEMYEQRIEALEQKVKELSMKSRL